MTPELLARFSAYAVEKYPVKPNKRCLDIDDNYFHRSAFLSGLIDCYEKFGREVAEGLLKTIGAKNWYVEGDGSVWEDAFTGLPSSRKVPFDELYAEYLKQFPEPDKKD